MQRAEELHPAIAQAKISWNDETIRITASMGLYCQAIQPDVKMSSILRNADDGMCEAKRQGRNRAVDISY